MSPRLRVGLIIVAVIAFAAVMMFLPTDAKFTPYFITVLGYATVIGGVVAILNGFRAPRGDPLRLSWVFGVGGLVSAASLLDWPWFRHPLVGLIGAGLMLWSGLRMLRSYKRVADESGRQHDQHH